jgi:hypothetical protein
MLLLLGGAAATSSSVGNGVQCVQALEGHSVKGEKRLRGVTKDHGMQASERR